MKNIKSSYAFLVISFVAVFAFVLIETNIASAYATGATVGIVRRDITNYTKELQLFTFFSATTTTATSTNQTNPELGIFKVAGARNVLFYFSRGGATNPNTGSSLFRIQTTRDGSNWDEYNRLVPVSGVYPGTSGDLARTGTSSIAAATSTTVYQMEVDGFLGVRCLVVETTDGEHSCSASAEFGY